MRHQNLSFRCEVLREALDRPWRPRKLLPSGARSDIYVTQGGLQMLVLLLSATVEMLKSLGYLDK